MSYFAKLNGMPKIDATARTEFLLSLLDLTPQADQLISTLSGGQQRRVSFALALLHRPQLLICDEPTVGVDPVLRARIWSHLRQMSNEHGTSVIITTHYIEEARQVNKLCRHNVIFFIKTPLVRCG